MRQYHSSDSKRFLRRHWLVAASWLAVLPVGEALAAPGQTVSAQHAPEMVTLSGQQALKVAEELLVKEEYDEAEAILTRLAAADPDKVDIYQVRFLTGLLAVGRKDFVAAEEHFRIILDQKPDLIRVRLELARSLYEQQKDGAAAYHFRYVLGNGLPEETKKIVRQFLHRIEARKVFHLQLGTAIVPNSNINNGPKDDTVTVFGLPFQLDDAAQKQSGTGLSTSLNVAAFPILTDRLRLETRAGARVVDYSNADFDDVFMSFEIGPRLQMKKANLSVLGAFSKRWFGGERFSRSHGMRMVLTTPLSDRMRFSLRSSYAQVDYSSNPGRSGPVYSGAFSVQRVMDKRTVAGLGFQVTREEATANNLKNHQYRLNGFISRELPWGITGQVAPDYYIRDFQSSSRLDETYGLSFRVTKRDWRYHGFAPVFSYSYLKNVSNNPFFNYDRHSADIGVTRNF
ncbi:surface lipoprotein assembly modifier [Parvularcula sp. IMCC14364]|uniref:surface lipoprotein assembly modifier n=1 Tax=Parvularcula sp. IMCC14364 TaxID=3067902 RepID=UPI0027423AF9|nr:surface lipoprotein assembly modifier [Parvularcula sp. IMCC14364]